jgi:hypothetical protein
MIGCWQYHCELGLLKINVARSTGVQRCMHRVAQHNALRKLTNTHKRTHTRMWLHQAVLCATSVSQGEKGTPMLAPERGFFFMALSLGCEQSKRNTASSSWHKAYTQSIPKKHTRAYTHACAHSRNHTHVQEAMRAASSGLTVSDEDGPSDPTAFTWTDKTGEDGGATASSSRNKWWQRRFQVCGLPRNSCRCRQRAALARVLAKHGAWSLCNMETRCMLLN